MAVFRENSDDIQGIDYRLLQNGFVTLYHRPEILAEDVDWLKNHFYTIDNFDCLKWTSSAKALLDFGEKLKFPDYYGQNLDAFNDCLSEIEIPTDGGRVFVFHRFDSFAQNFSDLAVSILDIIASNSRRFLLFGKRLITLVQSDNPNIDADLNYPPIGATSPVWNHREWLKGKRSISENFN